MVATFVRLPALPTLPEGRFGVLRKVIYDIEIH